ncbi:MAG TPA: amino acid permease [Burkholderiaceae bacterium]|nr:amino acid permease [Burkholderiaceae bacterium]
MSTIASNATAEEPREAIGIGATVALIVGIVVGAGIFKAPSLVAGFTEHPTWMFAAWALGGVVSLIGALCYAELATAFPSAGGDYHFLHRAYGRSIAFLFAWARFSVVTTGSIALLGFVFGDYMAQVLPLGPHGPALYAATAILVLTAVNLRGLRTGSLVQTLLTIAEVGGLLLVAIAGLFLVSGTGALSSTPVHDVTATPPMPSMFGLAMVFVLLTFGGWNEAAYVSAEVRDAKRNIVRALVLSIVLLTALYLVVVWAYWRGLGLEGMAKSNAVAADLLRLAFGERGAKLVSIMVAVSALTSINATMIVGARTNFAVGRDWPVLAWLGQWNGARGTPSRGLLVQSAAALVLVIVGASAVGGGFKAMVEFTAPVFWLFFLLSGISLFVLRHTAADTPRPFRVPLYPVVPALFCASCAFMLWSSLTYVYDQRLGGLNAAWIGVIVLAAGGLLLAVVRQR